ncbi:hypothetical protein BASA60_008525 [Batrachochytrium salamandrivorans]|nr:hypothetical protein BASA60_008525 [Batrachochytrium salamandrivorans]
MDVWTGDLVLSIKSRFLLLLETNRDNLLSSSHGRVHCSRTVDSLYGCNGAVPARECIHQKTISWRKSRIIRRFRHKTAIVVSWEYPVIRNLSSRRPLSLGRSQRPPFVYPDAARSVLPTARSPPPVEALGSAWLWVCSRAELSGGGAVTNHVLLCVAPNQSCRTATPGII